MKMLKVMSKLLIQTLLGLLLWLLPDPELLQAKKQGKWYQFVHQKKDRMQARWNGKHLEIHLKPRKGEGGYSCLLYTSPSPRDGLLSRMPSSA